MSQKDKDTIGLPNDGQLHQYELVAINTIKPYANNAKKHPPKQVQQIANSIQQFKFINPIIVDADNLIVNGHGRYEAAKLIGLKKIPVIKVKHLSDEEIKAYRLADNQLTLNTGYDENILRVELSALSNIELHFPIEITGFETAQIDIITDGQETIEHDPDDIAPEPDEENKPITQFGDVWTLGKHVLVCGDSTKDKTYGTLMNGALAHAIICDPPFNVAIDGHVCGAGKIKHDEFAMASGEMTDEEFRLFLMAFILLAIKYSRNGSLHYIFMDWRHIHDLITVGLVHYDDFKNICIWNKDNGGMGSLYRSKHEMVAVFKNGKAQHTNNILLGKYGRYRTNVWDYPGVNSFAGKKDLSMHPTVKPIALLVDAMKDCTKRGEIVLDMFAGSGSTLIACEKSGRHARCIELEPKYCDVIIKRWQELTGKDAIHDQTGKTFNHIQTEKEA